MSRMFIHFLNKTICISFDMIALISFRCRKRETFLRFVRTMAYEHCTAVDCLMHK